MKTTLRVAILMAIIVATMGTVSADLGSAQAAMSAAASQLGGMGADVIGGYGGSGSSGSSTGSQSAKGFSKRICRFHEFPHDDRRYNRVFGVGA